MSFFFLSLHYVTIIPVSQKTETIHKYNKVTQVHLQSNLQGASANVNTNTENTHTVPAMRKPTHP